MKYIKYRWDSQEWKDQHRKMNSPKLDWYDSVIADLIRIRSQIMNINHIVHFDNVNSENPASLVWDSKSSNSIDYTN